MKSESNLRPSIGLFRLSLIAIFVGIVTGFGAIAFRALIGFIHNLFFLGPFSFFSDANVHTPASPWGLFVVLVPVIGALIVTLLVTKFAPEARGHGVPEVMDAIYYSEGRIRPVVAAVKSLASSISIGTGAAVGREGPIIQIGASLGSTIGQIIPLAAWQRITLVAAGAATFIARLFVGLEPAFKTPPIATLAHHPASFYALLLYTFLGVLAGLAAALFTQGLHWT